MKYDMSVMPFDVVLNQYAWFFKTGNNIWWMPELTRLEQF